MKIQACFITITVLVCLRYLFRVLWYANDLTCNVKRFTHLSMKWKFKFKTKCIIWKNPWNYKYQLFTILVDYTEGDLLREVVDYGRWLVTGGGWLREAVHYGRSMVMGGGLLRELVEGGGWLHRRWLVTGGGWLREINGYGRRLITGNGWGRWLITGSGWLYTGGGWLRKVISEKLEDFSLHPFEYFETM